MDSQTPHSLQDYFIDLLEFLIRNLFGILSAMAGILYQVYQMSGRTKRMTRVQCVTSVLMWFIASIAIVIGLENLGINRLFYGLICWATPIVVKPIADTLSVKASPMTEKVLKSIEALIDGYTKRNK